MAHILVVEDDPDTRMLVQLHLESANHTVTTAADGGEALKVASSARPDLILSDLDMPNLDGFGMLEAIRSKSEFATVPVVFLTSRDDRETFRRSMQLGADDFVNKPVNRGVLLNAISGRLDRLEKLKSSVVLNSGAREIGKTRNSSGRLRQLARSGQTMDDTLAIRATDIEEGKRLAAQHQETVRGSVLFMDIRNFTTLSEALDPGEVVEMLNVFVDRASEPVRQQCGWVVKLLGDGMIAMFEPSLQGSEDHAERALKAALLIVLAAYRFQPWIERRHPGKELPKFAVGVGVHSGDIVVCEMGSGQEVTVIGDTVNTAARLEAMTKEFGWSICASTTTAAAVSSRIETGRAGHVAVKGKTVPVEVVEVTGLQPRSGGGGGADDALYADLREAVRENAATIEATKSRALGTQSRLSTDGGVAPPPASGGLIELEGYRLLRKIGEGGMSQVFLAENLNTHLQEVLKLVPATQGDEEREEMVQRFLEEFALISQIDHPNVARIFSQGFTTTHAYIVMEYFPGGDLRQLIAKGMTAEVALASLLQVLGALAAIHEAGIIHRDMKPDNVMIRADGSLALADFGIAKSMEAVGSHTRHGEIFGTPYYIAPEQAVGGTVDTRADIYSTGVMFFEMLTGRRPYDAQSAQALLYQHVHSPVPQLPAGAERFQPLLEKMMAKDRHGRFANANEALDFILASGLMG